MLKRKYLLFISLFLLFILDIFLFYFINKTSQNLSLDENLENVELAIYLEDEQINMIPDKESGYYYDRERSSCTNGAYINWDSVSWSPVVNNMSEYKTRCEIHFTRTYTEGILNGTDPILKEELVPVTIEDNGTVKKANLESEWYSYANKNWANSVILDDQYDTLNNQGKVSGATKNDGYVSFDGVDDYIDLGLENYDFNANGVTLMVRFILNSFSDVNSVVFSNVEAAGLGIYVRPDGTIRANFYNEDNSAYILLDAQEKLVLKEEYTVVIKFDKSKIYMYVNGTLEASTDFGTSRLKVSPLSYLLGANPQKSGSHTEYSDVNIKQAQLYSRALDDEEIKEISKGKVVNSEGLLRYVDFTNKSYENNEIIPESAIESYFVWIPKYRYQLWDLGNYDSLTTIDTSKVHEIPVIFGDYNTSDDKNGECTTPMESGKTGNCIVGNYMTHPAFISIPSTGFWVSKFETGYDGATSVTEAQQNINDSNKIIIKPNVYSWRGIQVANAFYSSYNYQRNLDSHMMKSTEWGAVAYLQHSAYGSQASVRINNNSNYVTGYASNKEPTCGYTGTNEECNQYCNDGTCNIAYPNSVLASTTGNISGIYDMAGGSWEYVMGVLLDENGNPMSGRNSKYNSGFNGTFGCPTCDSDTSNLTSLTGGYDFPDSKYYDIYAYATVDTQYQRRILGDATGEMGPFTSVTYLTKTRKIGSWYSDFAAFVYSSGPWFAYGVARTDGLDAGVFTFGNNLGYADSRVNFRVILTPTGGNL